MINVEAAHLYPNYTTFLAQVVRVLKPGGHFLYADLRGRDDVAKWESDLAQSGLEVVSCEDINKQVLRGLEKNSKRYQDLINRHAPPPPLRRLGRDVGVTEGSPLYEEVERGDIVYRLYNLKKP